MCAQKVGWVNLTSNALSCQRSTFCLQSVNSQVLVALCIQKDYGVERVGLVSAKF
jgi:hypothetical protein